jgi:hypothetical protein
MRMLVARSLVCFPGDSQPTRPITRARPSGG